jgi:hypothetical protein
MGHNSPCGPSDNWWVLTSANAAGTNGLTCHPKHGGARENKFLGTHPMTDWWLTDKLLSFHDRRLSALTAGPLNSSDVLAVNSLVAFYDINGRERSALVLSRTPHETVITDEKNNMFENETILPQIKRIDLVWCPGQNKRITPLSFPHGCRKRRLKD